MNLFFIYLMVYVIEKIELQAKLLNYFLGSNKSNINQYTYMYIHIYIYIFIHIYTYVYVCIIISHELVSTDDLQNALYLSFVLLYLRTEIVVALVIHRVDLTFLVLLGVGLEVAFLVIL